MYVVGVDYKHEVEFIFRVLTSAASTAAASAGGPASHYRHHRRRGGSDLSGRVRGLVSQNERHSCRDRLTQTQYIHTYVIALLKLHVWSYTYIHTLILPVGGRGGNVGEPGRTYTHIHTYITFFWVLIEMFHTYIHAHTYIRTYYTFDQRCIQIHILKYVPMAQKWVEQ